MPKVYEGCFAPTWYAVRVFYVVALAAFDFATARAEASRGIGKRRR